MAAFLLAGAPSHSQSTARGHVPAQGTCAGRAAIVAQLGGRFGERPVAMGLAASGNVIEVWAREDGATWTIVATTPDGLTCVVQTGAHWQPVIPRDRGEPS